MTEVALATEIAGHGPAIVLTHGLGDDRSTWDVIWSDLADSYTVTRWDLRGHGCSDTPLTADAYSPHIAVHDLLTVIRTCATPLVMVGHSLGGYLSLAVALRHTELVRSLVMISSGPGFRDPASRARWNRYVDSVAPTLPIPSAAARLAHQTDEAVIDNLPSLDCPLTQIVGEHDTRFHAGVESIQRAVPTASTHVIPGAGHQPQRTHPNEVLDVLEHAITRANPAA